jgi:hypothetical protein
MLYDMEIISIFLVFRGKRWNMPGNLILSRSNQLQIWCYIKTKLNTNFLKNASRYKKLLMTVCARMCIDRPVHWDLRDIETFLCVWRMFNERRWKVISKCQVWLAYLCRGRVVSMTNNHQGKLVCGIAKNTFRKYAYSFGLDEVTASSLRGRENYFRYGQGFFCSSGPDFIWRSCSLLPVGNRRFSPGAKWTVF